MARRGERASRPHTPVVPEGATSDLDRIGVRVIVRERRGKALRLSIDPSLFRCSVLVAELADEAVAYARKASLRRPDCYFTAVRAFGTFLDAHLPGIGCDPAEVALAEVKVDLIEALFQWGGRPEALFQWEGDLRARHGLRSAEPYRKAARPSTGCCSPPSRTFRPSASSCCSAWPTARPRNSSTCGSRTSSSPTEACGVRQIKLRADRIRSDFHPDLPTAKTVTGDLEEPHTETGIEVYPDTGKWDVGGLLRRLLEATRLARESFASEDWLFLAVEAGLPRTIMRAKLAEWAEEHNGLSAWITSHRNDDGTPAMVISQPHYARRLRKTVKTSRVAALGGTLTDLAADDHHIEIFRNHYAHGTTALTLSGRSISTAPKNASS